MRQLALGEDSRGEFKEVLFAHGVVRAPRRERIANELAAIGTTVGGALLFGVADNGELHPVNQPELDALESLISEVCTDSIRPPLPS